jgi:GNAT superfamily N-acetyltransferase
MRLAVVTHAEHPELRDTVPDMWPEFMRHDPVVQTFWPRLYELYPDFQLWVRDRDRRATVAYACTLPVNWDGTPSPRGIDWALSNGAAGEPTALCALVVAIVPEYRGRGLAEAILRRMGSIASAHGFDAMIAPVRPTWKDRYPLTSIHRYLAWRRADGLLYDPWLRTHERLGAELLGAAERSLTIAGAREEWEEWTELTFPEDGDYVVPSALAPVRFEGGRGTYVEPNVWMAHRAT